MEIVHDQHFYHIVRHGALQNMVIGKPYFFGLELNRFMHGLKTVSMQHFECDKNIEVIATLQQYITKLRNDTLLRKHHTKLNTLLEYTHDVLIYQSMTIRELIFESVRQTHFPNYPSRQRCIWLVDPNPKDVAYWLHKLDGGRIFEVAVTGKIHRGNDRFLEDDTLSCQQYEQNAFFYWSGIPVANEFTEVIAEGEITILRELSLESIESIASTKKRRSIA